MLTGCDEHALDEQGKDGLAQLLFASLGSSSQLSLTVKLLGLETPEMGS